MFLSSGAKWPWREADHLPPCSPEVKNEWCYTSTPAICLHGVCKDNFMFFFLYVCLGWDLQICIPILRNARVIVYERTKIKFVLQHLVVWLPVPYFSDISSAFWVRKAQVVGSNYIHVICTTHKLTEYLFRRRCGTKVKRQTKVHV